MSETRLTDDGQANTCQHGSATGVDTTSVTDPGKVWRCDHCGLRWTADEQGRRHGAGRHDRAYAGHDDRDPGVYDAPGSFCIQCSTEEGDYVNYPCPPLAADRDAAGVETRVRALAERYDHEADTICPRHEYDDEDKAWRVAHVRRRVAADLRAALSGPADEHPADGTGA